MTAACLMNLTASSKKSGKSCEKRSEGAMSNWLIFGLALAALFVVNTIVSLAVAALWLAFGQRASAWSVAARARWLFALRMFPLLSAFIAVLGLFIPAYLVYEPRPADEVVNLKIAALASLAAFGLLLMGWRGLMAQWAT